MASGPADEPVIGWLLAASDGNEMAALLLYADAGGWIQRGELPPGVTPFRRHASPGKVRRKGGALDWIIWQTGTVRLLACLLKGRKSGPVFVTERKARVRLPAAALAEHGHARLSYQQAAALFSEASGGATLHQLRHSTLTHDAEEGTGTPMLMARSGHTSVRSLAKYARVSAEALARHQAERDPARRR